MKKLILLCFLLTSVCINAQLTDWGNKQAITIDNGQVPGTVNLTDFPLLVTLDYLDSEIVDVGANSALNDDGDIRFTSDTTSNESPVSNMLSITTNNALTSFFTFEHIRGTDDAVMGYIVEGASILETDALAFNVNAIPSTSIGSVILSLAGPETQSKTESIAPYALYGDLNGLGDFNEGPDLVAGSYTLTATVWSGASASGTQIAQDIINFTVVSTVDNVPPTAPTLTSTGQTDTTVDLSWLGATDNVAVTGYNVYQNGSLITTLGNVSTYQVTGLTASTTYNFTVTALDAASNESVASNVVDTSYVDNVPPTAPTLTSTGQTDTTADLSWLGATDDVAVTGYNVYQNGVLITTLGNVSTYQITGLTASTSYNFTVTTIDAASNESVVSNTVTVSTLCSNSDTFSNGNGGGTHLFTYNSLQSVIINLDNLDNSFQLKVNDVNIHSEIMELEAARLETGEVPIVLASDNSYISSPWVANTNGLPRLQMLINSSGQVTLKGTRSSSSTELEDLNTLDNSNFNVVDISSNNVTISITNIDEGGGDVMSGSITAIQNCNSSTQEPTPPTLSSTAQTDTTVDLSWSGATDDVAVTGYNVYQNGSLITTLGNITTYQVTGLTASTEYNFTVTALDAAGNESVVSNVVAATTDTTVPTPPILSSTAQTDITVDLGWTEANLVDYSITRYVIQDENDVILEAVNPNVFNYQVTGLSSSTTYKFKVTAINEGGSGATIASNELTVTTNAASSGPSLELTVTGQTDTTVDLSWAASNIADVTNYFVYKDGVVEVNLSTASTSATSYTVTGLSSSTSYDFYVSSVNFNNSADNINSNTESVTTNASSGGPTGGTGVWSLNNQDVYYNDGNIGIGTDSPLQTLHINKASGSVYSYIQTGSNFLGIGLNNQFQYGPALVFNENSQLRFGKATAIVSDSASNFEEFMRITNQGQIGIGTETPDELLSVNGTIHSKEVKVDLNNWPDYVFSKAYNLPTLKEIETYIKENGHLQNIPSAKEVEKEGIQLGNMNAKLLEKIEELTLYIIQQEKRIESQSKEIDSIKKHLKVK